ncbi:pentapeptide repeat-containing protein [Oscillatoria sp. FACHB-1407]|uniref:pentapeptide repeat-containing protein n=1 Tax=Oscillatoria sp. FACHB-1407 TaxID=2692847 RepID=UPI00168261E9|nr:pentapeptide repeat-containing protein [Oscillatoria sp. FACHB-1407]MBD2459441.1 pentapeptide repeat-containing protein [Oscillatoria sp. FACHB-1407]
MKQIMPAAIAFLSLPIFLASPVYAQEVNQELYELCSRFPFNSRCEGVSVPIPLERRSGTRIICSLELNSPAESEQCRLAIADNNLTLYIEVGDRISLLDNQRATEEITIPLSNIFALDLRIWDRRADANSLLFGGSLYVQQPQDYSDVERTFNPSTDNDERSGFGSQDFAEIEISYRMPDVAASENQSNVLSIAASEEFGFFLREQITPNLASPASGVLLGEPEAISSATAAGTASNTATLTQQLLDTNRCIRCDLRGADLRGADLEDANLEGANLEGANLTEANLEGSYLVGANLSGATLAEADLSQAWLALASLTSANLQESNLQGASLQSANLQSANLSKAQLEGARLYQANLQEATLTDAGLGDVTTARNFIPFVGIQRYRFYTSLRGANLSGTNLQNADLEDVDVTDANLSGANLSGVSLEEVDLSNTILCGATLPDGSTSTQGCP